MKKIFTTCLTFFTCFNLYSQNLITNGGFESGFTGWNNLAGDGVATYSLSTADKIEGTQAFKVNVTTLGTNAYSLQTLGPNWTAVVGKVYSVSFYAKSSVAASSITVLQQNTKYAAQSFTLSTSWLKYEWLYTAGETSPKQIFQFPELGTFLIDGLTVTAYSPPVQSTTNGLGITPTTAYQTMIGFGGALAFYNNWIYENPNHNEIYQYLFQDLGLDWLRLRNEYNNEANFMTMDTNFVNQGKKYNPNLKIFISSWSPPANLKSNNSTKNGGTLLKENGQYVYGKFGDFWYNSLVAYAKIGIKADLISLQNEPDFTAGYESCRFDPTEGGTSGFAGYDKALDSVYDRIQKFPNPPQMIGAETFESQIKPFTNFNTPIKAKKGLYAYAYHLYDQSPDKPDTFIPALQNIATNFNNKPNIMSEYTHNDWFQSAWIVSNALSQANASGYFYWDVAYPGSDVIDLDCPYGSYCKDGNGNVIKPKYAKLYSLKPTYYAFKHFSKHIKPGYKRISGSNDNSVVKSSVFINPNGDQIIAVLLNTGSKSIKTNVSVAGYTITGSTVYQSVKNSYYQNKGSLPIADSLVLPDTSITTIVLSVKSQVKPQKPIVTASTYCQFAKAIALSASGSNLKWYLTLTGGSALGSVPVPSTQTVGQTSYFVSQTVNGSESDRSEIVVTVNPVPAATISPAGNSSLCQGESITLTSNNAASYKWFNGTAQVGTGSTYKVSASGSFKVETTYSNGCKDTSQIKLVTVNVKPIVAITSPANNAIVTTNQVKLNATVTSTNIGNVDFYQGTVLLVSDVAAPYSFTVNNLNNGNYIFYAIAKNTVNCKDTTSVNVKVNKVVTSIDETESEISGFKCFPNPFQHNATLEFNGSFEYEISNSNGVRLLTGKANDRLHFGEGLLSGIYFVKVNWQNSQKIFKVEKL